MMTLLLYTLLCTACFYLGSRAMITRALWSRYPPSLARFLDCSACSGFWYGVFWSLVLGEPLGKLFAIQAGPTFSTAFEAMLVGLCMLVLTPIGSGLMQHAIIVVGSAVDTDSNEGT